MSTQEVVRPMPTIEAGLRRNAEQGESCEFCSRSGKSVPAVVVVADSPMCRVCFMGSPNTGRTPVLVNGKTQSGCASERFADAYRQVAELIVGKREKVVVTCGDPGLRRKLQCNLVRKSVRLGVRVTSRTLGNQIVLRIKQV